VSPRPAPPRLPRRRLLAAIPAAAVGAMAARGTAAEGASRRLHALAYEGQWTDGVRRHLERTHGIALDVTVVATPAEALDRVRRATLEGPPGPDRRTRPVDLVSLGVEDVAAWRGLGLLSPLRADVPVTHRSTLSAHGAMEGDGRACFLPLSLGLDVMFAAGADVREAFTAEQPPPWSVLLDPSLKDRVLMEPAAAVWMALRLVDADGARLAQAGQDKAAARDLFKAVNETLAPWRAQLASVWTDSVTFGAALSKARLAGAGRAGLAWDSLARWLTRTWPGDPPPVATVPAEGSRAWLDGLAVPVGATAPATAQRLLKAMTDPAVQALWAKGQNALPADPAAWSRLDEPDARWAETVLRNGGGLERLWFPPALTGPAADAFADSRDRFEFA